MFTNIVFAKHHPYLYAPAGSRYAQFDPGGETILPDGRIIRPYGSSTPIAKWPNNLALSPDGVTAFVASQGGGQFITRWSSASPQVTSILPPHDSTGGVESSGGGAVFSPDGRTLYWSSGETGKVYIVNVSEGRIVADVNLNAPMKGKFYKDSFAIDLKVSDNGRYLYCSDVTNFRLVIVDITKHAVVGAVGVGRYPYALAVAGSKVYVANIGLFRYQAIPPAKAGGKYQRGLSYPAFGFPSQAAINGVQFEGRHVPGLGLPNSPEAFSVWGVDVSRPAEPRVISRIKSGLLIGSPTHNGICIGGSAPNFLAVQGRSLYVSDGNNDMVERIDLKTQRVIWRSRIVPSPLVAHLRGVDPAGLAVSSDGSRIYVAEMGLNAIGVLNAESGRLLGEIPTAWYPYRIVISHDGRRLGVICFRGFGNGPSGGAHLPKSPFLGMKGVFSSFPTPSTVALKGLTAQTLANNGITDRSADRAKMASPIIPTTPGAASKQIKYVVFITKENHTFDTIFDHIPGASSDPSLLRWGYHQTLSAQGQPTLTNVPVMINHNELAKQFTVSDNFYMEPEYSGVGHRWLVGIQPDVFCQMTYTLGWDFKVGSDAPGRLASFGSNGSMAPEDYPEAGSMWEHLSQSHITFRNYGEGFEFAGVKEDQGEEKSGAREVVNIPMPEALYHNTCRDFPIFNMNIPDQYRAQWFESDFTHLFLSPGKVMPKFINICLCNDHGTSPSPSTGYPYVASWMADNDLALGKIVDFLSHTKYWKNMVIFVTEDDSGGEPDHIDAQRSVLLAISPWIKRHYVSHRHTTIVSLHRTLYEILGLGPLNMFDALASDFSDCFTTHPNFLPYTHAGVDPRIFDPKKAFDPKDPNYTQAYLKPSISCDNPEDMQRLADNPGSVPARDGMLVHSPRNSIHKETH